MPPTVPVNASDPPLTFAAVTPSDTVDLPAPAGLPSDAPCRCLLLGVAGNVKVTDGLGITNVLPMQAGYNPGYFRRVWLTSTTATGIFALY
jgi:hypothetical protein